MHNPTVEWYPEQEWVYCVMEPQGDLVHVNHFRGHWKENALVQSLE